MLTPEQRDEGRRLLEAERVCHTDTTHWEPECAELLDWLWENRESLLADHAEISRAAVREFAIKILSHSYSDMNECRFCYVVDIKETALDEYGVDLNAAARGVTLDETP